LAKNREFHRLLCSGRARFCLTDFHVHSPASADVRRAPHFDQLSEDAQIALRRIPTSAASDPAGYEAAVKRYLSRVTGIQGMGKTDSLK
jgi:hypothetical protein